MHACVCVSLYYNIFTVWVVNFSTHTPSNIQPFCFFFESAIRQVCNRKSEHWSSGNTRKKMYWRLLCMHCTLRIYQRRFTANERSREREMRDLSAKKNVNNHLPWEINGENEKAIEREKENSKQCTECMNWFLLLYIHFMTEPWKISTLEPKYTDWNEMKRKSSPIRMKIWSIVIVAAAAVVEVRFIFSLFFQICVYIFAIVFSHRFKPP